MKTIYKKYKPWLVSLFCLLVALPLVLNSVFTTPITAGDLQNPQVISEMCAAHNQNVAPEGEIEESEGEMEGEACTDRLHRTETPLSGGWTIIGHMVGGSMMMLSAPITFNTIILRRRKRIHRMFGYTFILGGIIVGGTAILMTILYPHRFTYFNIFTNLLWGGIMFGAPLFALKSAKNKKFKEHRAWMIRGYAAAAGPAFHRWLFFLTPIIGDFGVSLGVFLTGEMIIRKFGLSTLRLVQLKVKETITAK